MDAIVQAKRVLEIFKEMSQIPRGSGNEKGISDYIVNFAKNLGLEAHQDEILNVVLRRLHPQAKKIAQVTSFKVIFTWYV